MKTNKQLKENSWEAAQSSLAEKSGLAIVVRDENRSVPTEANNNSVCRVLYSSEEFAPECDKYCGEAFEMARKAGKTIGYRCYAGLDCRAVPVKNDGKMQLVAIVGRAFTKADNYRKAATRAAEGDWKRFSASEFFENVLLTSSTDNLKTAAESLENLSDEEKAALFEIAAETSGAENGKSGKSEVSEIPAKQIETEKTSQADETAKSAEQSDTAGQTTIVSNNFTRKNTEEAGEIAEWRALFGSLLDLTYKKACASILNFLGERYNLQSSAWLEREGNFFEIVSAVGELKNREIRLEIPADDRRLTDAARREISIELRERNGAETVGETHPIRLFPVAVGGEIRSGLLLGGGGADENTRRHIARFCRTVAAELEILRLREELARRGWLAGATRKFNENLRKIDSEDFWLDITRIFAELMKAERSSLLVFDEKSSSLTAKAAIGIHAEAIRNEKATLGARVAARVLNDGEALVVPDVDKIGIQPAPGDWKYKSKSFICYPIEIGGRKIGVLNLTDKTGGETYDESDLDLLDAIVPQFAVLIDRAALKHKAGEFEQLSVTDALTGLLNRRYLEERLTEEIKRSNRSGLPMSFMMIDVDDFKSYNDNFSHPEGDKALKLVAYYLKDALRGADVAARYGGEEFSILLPQTTSAEARIIAERVRERIDAADFPNRKVTVSIGVASCSQAICTAQTIIKAADDALYEAKRRGRNNVQIYENL